MNYLKLDDVLAIACEVLGLEVDALVHGTDLRLADSALAQPRPALPRLSSTPPSKLWPRPCPTDVCDTSAHRGASGGRIRLQPSASAPTPDYDRDDTQHQRCWHQDTKARPHAVPRRTDKGPERQRTHRCQSHEAHEGQGHPSQRSSSLPARSASSCHSPSFLLDEHHLARSRPEGCDT